MAGAAQRYASPKAASQQSFRMEESALQIHMGRARELGMSDGDVYSLVRNRLDRQVVSLTQLSKQNLKHLYGIVMALTRKPQA